MKKRIIAAIFSATILLAWQSRTIKKRIAHLSGPFNDIITVCIKSMPIQNDTAFKHAGAHYKYDRFMPCPGGMQKQTCYVKLIFDREKNHLPAGRYSCNALQGAGFFKSQDSAHFNDLDLQPCTINFNRNEQLKLKYRNRDNDAKEVETLQEAIEKIKR